MTEKISVNPAVAQRWVLVLASIASVMVALDALVVSTALSTIRQHLGASIDELEWTVNAYSLSFAVLLITASALGDRFGRRRLFAGGLGLFVVSPGSRSPTGRVPAWTRSASCSSPARPSDSSGA